MTGRDGASKQEIDAGVRTATVEAELLPFRAFEKQTTVADEPRGPPTSSGAIVKIGGAGALRGLQAPLDPAMVVATAPASFQRKGADCGKCSCSC